MTSARSSTHRLADILPYVVIGAFLLPFLLSARQGPDMPFYLQWAQVFGQLDTKVFLSTGHTLSPLGVPLTQWSHGPGLVFSLFAAISGQFYQPDAAVLWIGRAFAVVFWWPCTDSFGRQPMEMCSGQFMEF